MNTKNFKKGIKSYTNQLAKYFFRPVWKFIYNLYKNIEYDDCISLATRIAFSSLFSLVPLLIVIITTLGFIGLSNETINRLADLLLTNVPTPIKDLLERNIVTIFSKPQRELLSIGIIFTIWGSTNVLSVALLGINRIFKGHSTRPFYTRRMIAFLFILCIGILSGMLYIFSHTISSILDYYKIENNLANLIISLKWPISTLAVFIVSMSVYYIAPPTKVPMYVTMPGAVFFTGFWNVLTICFKYYINRLGDFSAIYGTLTTGVLLMIWFYLAGLIFMVGGEINYLLYLKLPKIKKK